MLILICLLLLLKFTNTINTNTINTNTNINKMLIISNNTYSIFIFPCAVEWEV